MTRKDQPNDAMDSVIVECHLAEPPAKVWRALTVPELVAAWLMPNDIRPEIGNRFTMQGEPDSGLGGRIACEVLEIEPNRLLRYSWRGEDAERDGSDRVLDTVVTFELAETVSGGTHLRVVHSGFAPSLVQPLALLAAGSAVSATHSCMQLQPCALRHGVIRAANSNVPPQLRWAA